MTPKECILKRLWHHRGSVISGEVICREMEMSRVAVWKHIQALRREGIPVRGTSRGYCLDSRTDLVRHFCFPGRDEQIHFFRTLSSTMDQARTLAQEGAAHMSVVIADIQNKGRGRLGRAWYSRPGGLWMTLILKPQLPPPLAFKVNFAVSRVLCSVINRLFHAGVRVKWPNDLMAGDRKLAGVLSEMETRADMISFVNIGIGLNVNNDPCPDEPRAVSLRQITGRPVERFRIIQALLDDLEPVMADIRDSDVITAWKAVSCTLGRQVTIQGPGGDAVSGIAVDVDDSGALFVETAPGALPEKIIYGDCVHKPKIQGMSFEKQ